jgi:hypothetical protein
MSPSPLVVGLIILGLLCLAVSLLPARYDPAIRLREWLERRKP